MRSDHGRRAAQPRRTVLVAPIEGGGEPDDWGEDWGDGNLYTEPLQAAVVVCVLYSDDPRYFPVVWEYFYLNKGDGKWL